MPSTVNLRPCEEVRDKALTSTGQALCRAPLIHHRRKRRAVATIRSKRDRLAARIALAEPFTLVQAEAKAARERGLCLVLLNSRKVAERTPNKTSRKDTNRWRVSKRRGRRLRCDGRGRWRWIAHSLYGAEGPFWQQQRESAYLVVDA